MCTWSRVDTLTWYNQSIHQWGAVHFRIPWPRCTVCSQASIEFAYVEPKAWDPYVVCLLPRSHVCIPASVVETAYHGRCCILRDSRQYPWNGSWCGFGLDSFVDWVLLSIMINYVEFPMFGHCTLSARKNWLTEACDHGLDKAWLPHVHRPPNQFETASSPIRGRCKIHYVISITLLSTQDIEW